MRTKTAIAAAALAALVCSSAHAANLLVDAGFESGGTGGGVSGDPIGWTSVAASSGSDAGLASSAADAHSGLLYYDFAGVGPYTGNLSQLDELFQDVSTVAGTTYNWSFFEAVNGSPNSNLVLTLGGTKVVDQVDPANSDWTQVAGSFVATGSTTRVAFFGRNLPGGTHIDDVVFSAAGAAGGVPEPASWALMLAGFFGVGSAVRRTRRAIVSLREVRDDACC
jgi:hypothetical protein